MKYGRLGNSTLDVSPLCLGTMTFGDGADRSMSRRIYSACRDRGVNFIDCADVYAGGESESILGALVKGHRGDVVIASKAFYPTGDGPDDRGLGRRHLVKALHDSLARLRTDYIDVYYFHNFDDETPLEESLATADEFVRQGKVRCIGVSNFAAWQVMKAIGIGKLRDYARIACIQPMYNLLKRQCESELLPMAASEGLGVVPYSPMAGGYLSGKYLGAVSGQDRFSESAMYRNRYPEAAVRATVENFLELATEVGVHPCTLAVAWVMSRREITAPIVGARDAAQLLPSLAALDFDMTPELRERMSAFSPAPPLANDREEERA